MTPRYGWYAVTMTTLLLWGCAGTALPPALPDDRIRMAPTEESTAEDLRYPTPQEWADMVTPLPAMPSLKKPFPVEPKTDPKKSPPRRQGVARQPSPEQMVRTANADATVGPSQGKGLTSAIMRYDYNEDSIYEVYAAPNAPVFIRLPPGHHLAVPATLNPDDWVMSKIEMTIGGEIDQQGWVIRPAKAGLEGYINLISQEGFVAKCKVTSFEKTAMLEVSWNWTAPVNPGVTRVALDSPSPAGQPLRPEERKQLLLTALKPEPPKPQAVKLKAPTLNAERLHTGYTIAVVGKHTPPWVPVSVVDDGSKSLIRFSESLAFTSAPGLFAVHADQTPAPVEFVPYTSDNGETMMYIVPGLHPKLSLRGKDGMEVVITRVPNGSKQ